MVLLHKGLCILGIQTNLLYDIVRGFGSFSAAYCVEVCMHKILLVRNLLC